MFNKYFEKKGIRTRYYLHESFHDYKTNKSIRYDYSINPTCIEFTRYEIKVYKGDKFKDKLNVDAKAEKITGIFNFRELNKVLHNPTFKYNVVNIYENNSEYYCKDKSSNLYKFLVYEDKVSMFYEMKDNKFDKCIIYHGDFEKHAQKQI